MGNEYLALALLGRLSTSKMLCSICSDKVEKFKNILSKKEYEISGMCKKCQDGIFRKAKNECGKMAKAPRVLQGNKMSKHAEAGNFD